MSGLLAGKVWQSNLDAHLKPLAAALADIGNDDGTNIYPSVEYMAWLLGNNTRSVQRGIKDLKTLGVLMVEKNGSGGRGRTVHYRLLEDNLPKRLTWQELREAKKGDTMSSFTNEKGDIPEDERVTFTTQRVTPVSPDPSGTVSKQPDRNARARSSRKPTEPLYAIEELENSDIFPGLENELAVYGLDFEYVYRKWWAKYFGRGGIGRCAGSRATARQYTESIRSYFETWQRNETPRNGNGHGVIERPRMKTIKERMEAGEL